MEKPINATMHGVIDYAFAGIQLLGPTLLNLNPEFRKTYTILGTGFTAVNASTDTEVGFTKKLSMKTHQKADAAFLATLSALTVSGIVNKEKKARAFHLGFLGLALLNYLLTDYDSTKLPSS